MANTIGDGVHDRFVGEWRGEQPRLQREIDCHEAAGRSRVDEGAALLDFVQEAQRLFERQERRLLGFLPSNCSQAFGELTATLPPTP